MRSKLAVIFLVFATACVQTQGLGLPPLKMNFTRVTSNLGYYFPSAHDNFVHCKEVVTMYQTFGVCDIKENEYTGNSCPCGYSQAPARDYFESNVFTTYTSCDDTNFVYGPEGYNIAKCCNNCACTHVLTQTYTCIAKPQTPKPTSKPTIKPTTLCKGLSYVSSPLFAPGSSQAVVNDGFKTPLQNIIKCAKANGARLLVVSTSRCTVPPGGATNSMHLLGMGIDVELYFGKVRVSKAGMAAAWCAFHPATMGCKGKKLQPKNGINTKINNVMVCIQKAKIRVGADFKIQDGNHFDAGTFSTRAKNSHNALLRRFCKGQCSNVKKINPGEYVCKKCAF